MTKKADSDLPWLAGGQSPTLVGEGVDAPPFMPGILVHSLLTRGVPFKSAYTIASEMDRRLQGVARVQRHEISSAVLEMLTYDPNDRAATRDLGIEVLGAGASMPFSKGVLAQSLSAAAIEPLDAFRVAREIEEELVRAAMHEIDRAELRALAHRVLRRHSGEEAAERYLVWRRYEQPETPVFLLLGGTSGVGKTTLALEVARRLGIGRVLSTDSIRQVMRLMISPELVPSIHTSSYEAHRVLGAGGATEANVLAGFRAQATSVAVGVRASLDRSVEESANLVIDGVSLLPGVIDHERYAGRAVVVFCVVATLDEAALRDRFRIRASGQRQRHAHRYLDHIDAILMIQRHLIEEAEKRNMLVIDNVDLDGAARQILAHLLDELRKVEAPGRRS